MNTNLPLPQSAADPAQTSDSAPSQGGAVSFPEPPESVRQAIREYELLSKLTVGKMLNNSRKFSVGEENEVSLHLFHRRTKAYAICRLPSINASGHSLTREELGLVREDLRRVFELTAEDATASPAEPTTPAP